MGSIAESSEADAPVAAGICAGLSALIVDDESHVRVYLRTLLGKLGVQDTWQAANGEEALALYRTYQPDVVLLDINMPYLSGVTIMRQIVAMDPDAAVVVVTSDQSTDTVKQVSDLGAVGYVLKHLPPAQMQALMAETLALIEPRAKG